MRLTSLSLSNFRACRETLVSFAQDLTVLVGENASGKSAVIDALRLTTFPASGRQTAWFSAERDLSHSMQPGESVTLTARYGELSEAEQSIYMAGLIDTHDDLIYTASFATAPNTPRRSVLSWSIGESMAEDPEPMLRRRISHVYLPPLRDAVRDLDGTDQTELHEVLRLLLAGDHLRDPHDDATTAEQVTEVDFISTADEAMRRVIEHPVATRTRQTIQDFFSQTTPPTREHVIELNRREMELRRIARLLRIQLAEKGIPIGDIASTGLGYASLLYVAMIVLQLVKAKDSDLTLLLVEEPEAHLHPQLQLVLLGFLQDQASSSGQQGEHTGPAGKVQVIVTTHSPVLASTVSVRQVVVIARETGNAGWCSKATALGGLGLTDADIRKIDRYLNSTRAALLFARDVVLVEGIAELLLLPALARYHFESPAASVVDPTGLTSTTGDPSESPEQEKRTRELRRQFASATIVSVEGVDFEPYLQLLLHGNHPRVDRVVVVTDLDHTSAGAQRQATYQERFADDVTAGRLVVVVGGTTLEAEVFREPANEALLQDAFLTLHPRSAHRWTAVAAAADGRPSTERAETFAKAIRARSLDPLHLDISKGDFAHLVAEAIETQKGCDLVVPGYLRRAIDAVAGPVHAQR